MKITTENGQVVFDGIDTMTLSRCKYGIEILNVSNVHVRNQAIIFTLGSLKKRYWAAKHIVGWMLTRREKAALTTAYGIGIGFIAANALYGTLDAFGRAVKS